MGLPDQIHKLWRDVEICFEELTEENEEEEEDIFAFRELREYEDDFGEQGNYGSFIINGFQREINQTNLMYFNIYANPLNDLSQEVERLFKIPNFPKIDDLADLDCVCNGILANTPKNTSKEYIKNMLKRFSVKKTIKVLFGLFEKQEQENNKLVCVFGQINNNKFLGYSTAIT